MWRISSEPPVFVPELMAKDFSVRVLPSGPVLHADDGDRLYDVLRSAGLGSEAFCGGQGRCGKCTVNVDGLDALSCRTFIHRDMTVTLPAGERLHILTDSTDSVTPVQSRPGPKIAFDIGTTTVVCFLMDESGKQLAVSGELNPQVVYGADVVSRIRSAAAGTAQEQRDAIRRCMTLLIKDMCGRSAVEPSQVSVVSLVGNPAMQQLFLGLDTGNLIRIPFSPVLTKPVELPCGEYLPLCPGAALRIVPDVSAYVGADTVGCMLSTGIYESDELTLLVDIGTNGEMVLGNKQRMLACATAAGPALEGANIRFGMRASPGAIDRVYLENGELRCHVIGDTAAKGICGSGLIDAIAVFLEQGRLDRRGHILPKGEDVLPLCNGIYLTQEDIRQVQLAKGAVAAGIACLVKEYGVAMDEIRRVLLAGAFGSFLSPVSAYRIGLLPKELSGRITAVGNAAGAGARLAACDDAKFALSGELAGRTELVELGSLPSFRAEFAKRMYFET